MTYGLQARSARPHDFEAFIALAEMFMAEQHPSEAFNHLAAQFTFSGFMRADPAIVVLERSDKALVGFVTATIRRAPFSEGFIAIQDDLFVMPEFRNGDAEAFLLLALHHLTTALASQPILTRLSMSSAKGGLLEFDHLRSLGYAVSNVDLTLRGKPLTPVMPTAQ